MDEAEKIITGLFFFLGIAVGVLMVVFDGETGGTRYVDMKVFSERVCAGVNLTVDRVSYEESSGYAPIPVIHCKKPSPSIYDGVVIGG